MKVNKIARTVFLVLVVGILLLFTVFATTSKALIVTELEDHMPTRPSPAQERETQVRGLSLGVRVGSELHVGEVHSYAVNVEAGQYLKVVVEQKGVDVAVSCFDPSKQRIAETGSPNGTHGNEVIHVIAESAGRYRLDLRMLDEKAPSGSYEISIEELRQSTESDRILASAFTSAHKALAAGEEILALGTAESMRKAIEKFQEAISPLRIVEDRWREAAALNAIGLLYRLSGEPEKALEYYKQVLPLRRLAGDRMGEGVSLQNIGSANLSMGNLSEALQLYDQALQVYRSMGNKVFEARALNGIGGIYRALGELNKAQECLDQSLSLAVAAGSQFVRAETLDRLGDLYWQMNDAHRAMENYSQALSLWQEVGANREKAVTLSNIGNAYWLMNEPQKALEFQEQALLVTREVGNPTGEAAILYRIGLAYRALGKLEESMDYFDQALALQRAVGNKSAEATTLASMGLTERDRGRLNEARDHIAASLDILERTRSRLINQDLRNSYVGTNHLRYELYIDILMRLNRLEPSAGYDVAALYASEKARARGLLDLLAEARADIRQGADPVLLERERSLQARLNAKADVLTRLLSGKHTAEQESVARKDLDSALADFEDVETRIRANGPRYAALTQPKPLSLTQIQKQVLDEDTLLLEYALGDERSYLWMVSSNSIASYELPGRAEIEKKARRVYDLLISKADLLYPEALNDLSETLLGPVASQLGRKRLLIVGDGALNYMPFAALPKPRDPKTREASATTNYEPLILEHEIVSSPSATVVDLLRKEGTSSHVNSQRVMVIADPVFTKDDKRVALNVRKRKEGGDTRKAAGKEYRSPDVRDVERSAREVGIPEFQRLPLSRREAEFITGLIPKGRSRKALDFAANRSAATSPDLPQFQIIHFATHSLLNNEHPALSGIVLSLVNERGEPQDGFLRLHEIYNLKLSADLIVLSACQTALGKEIRGEGLVGLTRGFMYAGTPRVVASMWKVSDSATAELMKRFYRRMLEDKMTPSSALRAAQISMLKDRQWQAPYYWAPFVLQGEWK